MSCLDPRITSIFKNWETLPRTSFDYKIDAEHDVFLNISTNFRTPSQAALFNTYLSGKIYQAENKDLRPEYSISEDFGYRASGSLGFGSLSLFNYNFKNRQIATLVGGSFIPESVNAGSQTTYGVDVEGGTKSWFHVSAYGAGEWLHSTDNTDLPYGNTYLPTAGKTSVRSPSLQASLGQNYDDGHWFADTDLKYVGSQYSTFMNDEIIPSYLTANLALGYRI